MQTVSEGVEEKQVSPKAMSYKDKVLALSNSPDGQVELDPKELV